MHRHIETIRRTLQTRRDRRRDRLQDARRRLTEDMPDNAVFTDNEDSMLRPEVTRIQYAADGSQPQEPRDAA